MKKYMAILPWISSTLHNIGIAVIKTRISGITGHVHSLQPEIGINPNK